MEIKQFEDKRLSHFSYAVLSDSASEVVVIDPARDVQPYIDYAGEKAAKIVGVIETHPHADFVSGHLELHNRTGASIYCSSLQQVSYPHIPFDEGDVLEFGKIKLKPLNTPGHSPDSISIVLEHDGREKAVFTGDTLFIGDCGRPDLRENTGNVRAKREELAANMYYSLRDKLLKLNDDVIVYPAHGAGTLCGKSLSHASQSTIGEEKQSNWSLQGMSEDEFVRQLTSDQPFVPKYFGYDVSVNRRGAGNLDEALARVSISTSDNLDKINGAIIIDARETNEFKSGHLPNSVNIQEQGKFETWLGSVVRPEEPFYLVAADQEAVQGLIRRAAKIGYEGFIKAAIVSDSGTFESPHLDLESFKQHRDNYTIVDVRNLSEVRDHQIFANSINIPLPELRERANEIPAEKPVVVHCAGGYRSAVGASILENALAGRSEVFDLGRNVGMF